MLYILNIEDLWVFLSFVIIDIILDLSKVKVQRSVGKLITNNNKNPEMSRSILIKLNKLLRIEITEKEM